MLEIDLTIGDVQVAVPPGAGLPRDPGSLPASMAGETRPSAPCSLVSGAASQVDCVGDALEAAGFAVTRAGAPDGLNDTLSAVPPRSLHCYVQLPGDAETGAPEGLDGVRTFLADGLVARFDSALAVAPLLHPHGCVVLVAPDAGRDLLQLLARAISGGSVGGELKVVVVGADHSPQEIARLAWHRGEDREWVQSRVAALSPELSYADWKRELFCLTTLER